MDGKEDLLKFLEQAIRQDMPSYQIVAGVRALLDPESDVQSLAEVLHTTLCSKSHNVDEGACQWYLEESQAGTWGFPAHATFLDFARSLMTLGKNQQVVANTVIAITNILNMDIGWPVLLKTLNFLREIESDEKANLGSIDMSIIDAGAITDSPLTKA